MWGVWAVLVTASLLLTQLQIATQKLSCHEENIPWAELGHNKQLILLQFSASPYPLPVIQHPPQQLISAPQC